MDEIEWWEFDSARELAEQAAGDIGFVIESALEAHADARLALPGEDGVAPVFSALAKAKGFDWSKVSLLPTADALSPPAGAQSLRERLEGWFAAKGAEIFSLVDEAAAGDPAEAARLADARLSLLRWPLDFVCLGMDAEGGTAGLRAGADLDRVLNAPRGRHAVGVHGPDGSAVTLTGPTLTTARTVMIVINGRGKRALLEQAIKEGPLSSRPIGRLLATIDSPVDVFWTGEEQA
ncbi:MAG TPA: 6-phosphogluconolactonase [Allosphingosinicella sp.]|nr:6-phosphogluconolactonase [Allosphingosinicella sp.]